jgi:hypothetical protein
MNSYRLKANNWKIRDDVDYALQLVVGGWGLGPASPEPWKPIQDDILYAAVHRATLVKTEHQGLDKFVRSVARA